MTGRIRRRLLGGGLIAAAILALGFAAEAGVSAWWGPRRIEDRINAALFSAGYRARVSDVEVSLFRASLKLRNTVLVSAGRDSVAPSRTGSRRSIAVRVILPEAELAGIGRFVWLLRRGIAARSLRFDRPRIEYVHAASKLTAPTEADSIREPNPARKAASAAPAAPARTKPRLKVGVQRLSVNDGALIVHRPRPEGYDDSVEARGIYLQAVRFRIDSTTSWSLHRIAAQSEFAVTVAEVEGLIQDSLVSVHLEGLEASNADSVVRIERLRLHPTLEDPEFFRRLGHRADRVELTAGPIVLRSFDLRDAVADGDLRAGSLTVNSLDLDVFTNKQLAPSPTTATPRLPNELVRCLSSRFSIDSVYVRGRIRYTELAPEGSEPGTVLFDSVDATIGNLTNDPRHMTSERPMVAEIRTLVYGTRVESRLEIPLLEPQLEVRLEGALRDANMAAFNPALVPLAGVRIESGVMDTLWFGITVTDRIAHGKVGGIYRDLRVKLVNRDTGESDLLDDIRSFFVNWLGVSSENLPAEDGTLRDGIVDHEIRREDPFFDRLWRSLRSGVWSLLRA